MPTHKSLATLILALLALNACAPMPLDSTPLPEETLIAFEDVTTTVTPSPSLTPFLAETATTLPATAATTALVAAPSETPAPTEAPYIPGLTPTYPGQPTLPPPTASAEPTTSSLPVFLTTDHENIVPGELVTLNWTSDGSPTSQVQLVLNSEGGSTGAIQVWNDLPPNGSLQTTIPDAVARDRYYFSIHISDGDRSGSSLVPMLLPCPDEFFFDRALLLSYNRNLCPTGPASYPAAAEQLFEGGRMIWLQSDNRIYVLYNNLNLGQGFPTVLQIFENPWHTGDSENDPTLTHPANLQQPTRGFGAVWRGEAPLVFGWQGIDVRANLGWAVSPEIAFTSADQTEWRTCVVRAECSDIRPYRYLRLSNGQVIMLSTNVSHGSVPFWSYLNP